MDSARDKKQKEGKVDNKSRQHGLFGLLFISHLFLVGLSTAASSADIKGYVWDIGTFEIVGM